MGATSDRTRRPRSGCGQRPPARRRLPDVLIAAAAERHRVTVLHYDHDDDRIAAVTGQPVEWVVPAGSVA